MIGAYRGRGVNAHSVLLSRAAYLAGSCAADAFDSSACYASFLEMT